MFYCYISLIAFAQKSNLHKWKFNSLSDLKKKRSNSTNKIYTTVLFIFKFQILNQEKSILYVIEHSTTDIPTNGMGVDNLFTGTS